MTGVRLADSPYGSQLLTLESTMCTTSIVLSLVFALVIVFLNLLTLRVDGKIDWNYYKVFAPIWILCVLALYIIFHWDAQRAKDDVEACNALDIESEGDEPLTTEQREAIRQSTLKRRNLERILVKVFRVNYFVLFYCSLVLIITKANDPTSIKTVLIFVPYYVMEAMDFLLGTIQRLLVFMLSDNAVNLPLRLILSFIFDGFLRRVNLVALTVLITLRIDGVIDWSWGIVFIPLYLPSLWLLKLLLQAYRSFSRAEAVSARNQGQTLVCSAFIAWLVAASFVYSLIGLLAARLDGHNFALSNVLMPLYIVLSILLCCSGCCLPCSILLMQGQSNADWTPENDTEGPRVRLVPAGQGTSSTYGATSSSARTGQSSGGRS